MHSHPGPRVGHLGCLLAIVHFLGVTGHWLLPGFTQGETWEETGGQERKRSGWSLSLPLFVVTSPTVGAAPSTGPASTDSLHVPHLALQLSPHLYKQLSLLSPSVGRRGYKYLGNELQTGKGERRDLRVNRN